MNWSDTLKENKKQKAPEQKKDWGIELPPKEKAIIKARELGAKYQGTLVGCGHSSFAATVDALESVDVKFVPKNVKDKIFTGVMGLTSGGGNCAIGSCGAFAGASLAVSLASGVTIEENKEDLSDRWLAYRDVKKYIVDKFMERWGAITCREIQIKNFGRAYNSQMAKRSKQLFEAAEERGCRNPYVCTISRAAGWATEGIWEILNRSSEEKEEIKEELKRKQAAP